MADTGGGNVQDTQAAQRKQALEETAAVSTLVRQALVNALPVAPEQYMTLSLPGTVIDVADIAKGGSYVYDPVTNPFTPSQVRQAEAKLVDSMMPLASIMIGNTGKSVARSYASALDYLVPKKATVSTEGNRIRSPGDKSYDDAMKYLTKPDTKTGKTPVEVYIEKQIAWATAQDAWDEAKAKARQDATNQNKNDNTAAVQQYNDWAQTHYRRFKEDTQARWMDWVTNGNKYNVEYNFGLVDVDSIMGRIESSKQSMRNSTIVDADGANELQEVNLTPKTWASLCRDKVEGFKTGRPAFTRDQVTSEISRLTEFEASLNALKTEVTASPPTYPKDNVGPKPDITTEQAGLTTAYSDLYQAQGKANGGDNSVDLNDKRDKLTQAIAKWEAKSSEIGTIQTLLDRVADQLTKLQALLKDPLLNQGGIVPIISATSTPTTADPNADPNNEPTSGNNVPAKDAELALPIFNLPLPGSTAPPVKAPLDPWTNISLSFSSADQKKHTDESSWGFSVSAGGGWGLFSGGGSYSHDESTSNMRQDMSNCAVSLNFSAMVVNIDRPWLYGELFNDFEIDIGGDARLSPGPELLHAWMDAQGKDPKSIKSLAMYNVFPSYPTAFILACNTEIEFTGDTSHIEQHFHSSSTSSRASVGWGPFSASASFHSSSSSSDFSMTTTATGCKITFGAPQIIAWVSQILPALPRDASFEPLLQGPAPK
ncbi:hypothetical protein B0T24DRAFT_684657 [Lasiosphaeria ovina]|uniref:Uncharacterized protein n=1 Tax=Lasiosphaeria ovina TaxID=92902 RepID=A0AAE0MYD2_9PEZI|nr:hypothetical protein B0T24DRAFT_684657 [Lasiosphaeria ovina]